ncbi:hypothetical protein C7M84_024107 [Penaeus vannamei]|uniref:Ionotropic glutamate receptor L-glutamate and glycine-binding domain-containing protein n=1 Tax=Penaeus vannamei TaxID=6689 RepID=A0A423U207_PENVA|nr:hypothetical protein C7M84_024107 [Penaeus vannamei]
MDLQGFNFTVAAIPYSPFVIDKGLSLPGPGRYRGFEITLLDELATAVNFTYHYVRPKDGQWGRLTSSGNWTGMIGHGWATERADFAVSDIGISTPRRKPSTSRSPSSMTPRALHAPGQAAPAVARPDQVGGRQPSMCTPFTPQVWLAVAAAVVTAGPFLTLVTRFCAGSSSPKVRWFQDIANAVMFTTQPVFQRGNHRDILEAPGRVFVGFWLLFSMILGITYSSSLISFLVSPGMQEPIKNLEELVTSDIDWARNTTHSQLKQHTQPHRPKHISTTDNKIFHNQHPPTSISTHTIFHHTQPHSTFHHTQPHFPSQPHTFSTTRKPPVHLIHLTTPSIHPSQPHPTFPQHPTTHPPQPHIHLIHLNHTSLSTTFTPKP